MSARIPASHEPERPLAAAHPIRPVLEAETHDTSMTALAEPEPNQIETFEPEELAAPQPVEADPSGSTMIVFEDVRKVYVRRTDVEALIEANTVEREGRTVL